MDERESSPEDLESDFNSDDNDSVDESNDNYDSDAIENLGTQLPVSTSRASLSRSQCSQYSSSTEEESQSNNLKVRKRRKKRQKSSSSCNNSSVNASKLALIENALTSCDKDKLSQLAVSQGGLLSDEVIT